MRRYTELVPFKTNKRQNKKCRRECAKAFRDDLFKRYSSPEVLITDIGLEFVNKMSHLCTFYNTK